MIKPACGAGVNLGDLKGGQSSELSISNKGPWVGEFKVMHRAGLRCEHPGPGAWTWMDGPVV